MKRNVKCTLGVWAMLTMMYSLCGCGSDTGQSANIEEKETEQSTGIGEEETEQFTGTDEETEQETQSGEDLDVVEPSTADDEWYKNGDVYTDDTGRRLEAFFDDEGMLEFAIDGLSMYYTTVDDLKQENDWKIYTCDDGTVIIYYPGTPSHIEISDGEYAGIYEAGKDKAE